jgi:hypothetical protein
MTPEERAFCEEIRHTAMDIIGYTGLIERDADPDSKQAKRANKASVALLGLVQKATQRLNAADVATEAQELAAADYDLAALATAPPARVED